MGRLSPARFVVTVLLMGSAALAQQGLIVEPWRQATPRPVASIAPGVSTVAMRRPMPASGLPSVDTAAAPRAREAALPSPSPTQWKPPVVALLVDPWAAKPRRTVAAEPGRVPLSAEIVDPWAPKLRAAESQASRRPPHSTIF